MKEIKGASGATIKISVAPFKDSMALKNAMIAELADHGTNVNAVMKGGSLNKFFKKDLKSVDFDEILKPILYIDSSENFSKALFACMGRCTYNNAKITEETFEDEQARADYYPIAWEVLKANLTPFFGGLASKLQAISALMADIMGTESKGQKSK